MNKKNIYLVQVGEKTLVNNNTAYFPYAVGAIAAKAWGNPVVSDAFRLERIVFLREPLNRLTESIYNPFLVGFSCYIWNTEYNKAAAKQIKSRYPHCVIVFGGHHVPADTSLLDECDAVDVLVHGEGEEVFEQLLCALANNRELSTIPNLSYRNPNGKYVQTQRLPLSGDDYPSPYTGGFFNAITQENPNMNFHGTLETNRGCSNNCAFCDWGPHSIRAKMFSMERIRKDLDWLSNNKVDYVWITDANFGGFDRDYQIADWIIEHKQQVGYPRSVRANYAKNNNNSVFELAKRFSESDLSKSTTISFQSLSDEALRNVGRHNISMPRFADLMKEYHSAGIPTYSEMILGLPGETYESFTDGLEQLLDAGQHSMIEVYDCIMLPNSVLAQKEYIQKHRLSTVRVPFFQYHCEAVTDDVTEYADVIISTSTLPADDWVRCKLFSAAVQSMHCMGLLRCFAVYLHNEHHVGYKCFYSGLVQWLLENPRTLGGSYFVDIRVQFQKMVSERFSPHYYDAVFGDVRWPPDEGAFLSLSSNYIRFYEEIREYLQSFFIDADVFEQLMTFQKNVVCIPTGKTVSMSLDFDFLDYLLNSTRNEYKPLQKRKTIFTITPVHYSSPVEYAREVVWYGRRLGKTLYLGAPDRIHAHCPQET